MEKTYWVFVEGTKVMLKFRAGLQNSIGPSEKIPLKSLYDILVSNYDSNASSAHVWDFLFV